MIARPDEVAGTTIEHADDDDRARTLILSDVHVPREGGEALGALAELLQLSRAEPSGTRVMVLGDLFDLFINSRQLQLASWSDVAEHLKATADAGVSVSVLRGNRDYLLDDGFEKRTGCRVVRGGLRCRLAGRSALLLHGDELLLRDRPYQRMKRFLRHPMTRFATRCLPLSVALWIGGGARERSTRSRLRRPADPLRYEPIRSAVAEAYGTGAELLVFGHIHQPARGWFDQDCEYCVLPAFDEEGVYLHAEGDELEFRSTEGQIMRFGAREFPES